MRKTFLARNQRAFEVWRTNLRLLRECAATLDANLFVAKQATLIVPDLPHSYRALCKYHYHGFDHDAHVRAFEGIYTIIDDEIPDDSIIDLSALSGRSEYFWDHIHPTPEGTTAFAEIVARDIEEFIRRDE